MEYVQVLQNSYGDYFIYCDENYFTTYTFKFFAVRRARKIAEQYRLTKPFTPNDTIITKSGRVLMPVVGWTKHVVQSIWYSVPTNHEQGEQ